MEQAGLASQDSPESGWWCSGTAGRNPETQQQAVL